MFGWGSKTEEAPREKTQEEIYQEQGKELANLLDRKLSVSAANYMCAKPPSQWQEIAKFMNGYTNGSKVLSDGSIEFSIYETGSSRAGINNLTISADTCAARKQKR